MSPVWKRTSHNLYESWSDLIHEAWLVGIKTYPSAATVLADPQLQDVALAQISQANPPERDRTITQAMAAVLQVYTYFQVAADAVGDVQWNSSALTEANKDVMDSLGQMILFEIAERAKRPLEQVVRTAFDIIHMDVQRKFKSVALTLIYGPAYEP